MKTEDHSNASKQPSSMDARGSNGPGVRHSNDVTMSLSANYTWGSHGSANVLDSRTNLLKSAKV